jgi:oligopeptide transport system substrate-binding protein
MSISAADAPQLANNLASDNAPASEPPLARHFWDLMTISSPPRNATASKARREAGGATAVALAAALAVFSVSAAKTETVFRRGEAGDPSTFDPQRTSTVIEADVLYDLFEGLLTYDAAGALIPGAAESWSVSADGLTYRFKLREAQWSNGDPVRARDFVFSFRRLLDPATGAEYANLYYPLKNAQPINQGRARPDTLGVLAIDDKTVEITLERPTPYFLSVLAHETAAPVNPGNVERYGPAFARPGNLVSNGAFRLLSFTPNDETVMVRNPYFHAAREVSIDKEIIESIDDRAAAFRRFRAGEIDTYNDAPADQLAFVRKTLKEELHITPSLGVLYFAFNTRKAPFNDARVRNALSMVIDREFLADNIWGGAVAPAYAFVPPGIDNYVTGVAAQFVGLSPIDREERARELLKEAGFDKDRPLKIEIRYNTSENNKATAIAIADMWKPLGVETSFINADIKTHFSLLQDGGDFDVARAGWIGDYSDPQNFLFLAQSDNGKLNYARWANPAYDALMARAATETDVHARAETLAEAENLLLREAPVIPLLFYESKNMVSSKIKGWRDNLLDRHLARFLSIE